MSTQEEIEKLSGLWYRLVNLDHHKDRDCHWYISTAWSYGQPPVYEVQHGGYVHERIYEKYPTYDAALEGLAGHIRDAIQGVADWALSVQHNDEDFWNESEARMALDLLKDEGWFG